METTIIKIGNSQGLIIPKQMLNRLGAKKKVDIQIKDGGLFIVPINDNPRKDWGEAFATAIKVHEPESDYFEGTENEFDKEEWTW